jgi:hypothetical protein
MRAGGERFDAAMTLSSNADSPLVEPVGFEAEPRPHEQQMQGMDGVWAEIAGIHGLVEPELGRLASWWHTDADLGRDIEVVTDISKSRLAGFTAHHRTVDSFTALFDRYRAERLIPATSHLNSSA